MAQPGISAKIEELQFRIKTDPKSRLFFPLAEELRRNGKLPDAEQVLRTGLVVHANYLSAWVSLGRVLREQGKNADAVEALNTALQVDPGNVVAARLLADAYLDLGEKVEAIKKYKLVHALMPSDEELEARIAQLDRDLSAVPTEPVAPVVEEQQSPFDETETGPSPEPDNAIPSAATADVPFAAPQETPFDETAPITHTVETPFDTGDEIPMAAQHVESPFEEPSAYTEASLEIEQPAGMHVEEAPAASEESVWAEEPQANETAADVFAPSEPEAVAQDDDITATTTMADLYVRQGLLNDARRIYEHLLQRDPYDDDVRAKLEALDAQVAGLPGEHVAELSASEPPQPDAPATEAEATWHPGNLATPSDEEPPPQAGNPATLRSHGKAAVLEQWLAKVSRREPSGV